MSTDQVAEDLDADLTGNTENSPRELLVRSTFFACALLSVLTTVGIVVLLSYEAAKLFTETAWLVESVEGSTVSIVEFLGGTEWEVSDDPPLLGVLPLVTGTLIVTVGSGLIAIPLGVATAIYLSEYASPRARSVLKPALEILAGIPSIIYGFFALVYIAPLVQVVFPQSDYLNALTASVVVGFMVLPLVSSVSEDALGAVPDELKQAGYGMGATKFEVTTGIVVPAALSGIFSSFILGLSRAIGETMAVTLAMGKQDHMYKLIDPSNPPFLFPEQFLESGMTMTVAMIELLKGDLSGGGLAYRSLYGIGITLFAITLLMNIVSDHIARRYQEEYE